MTAEPDAYVCQRVRAALAHDPRVGDLGLTVEIAGGRLFVTGAVTTEERQRAVADVAAAAAPELEVVSQVGVVPVTDADGAETLS